MTAAGGFFLGLFIGSWVGGFVASWITRRVLLWAFRHQPAEDRDWTKRIMDEDSRVESGDLPPSVRTMIRERGQGGPVIVPTDATKTAIGDPLAEP